MTKAADPPVQVLPLEATIRLESGPAVPPPALVRVPAAGIEGPLPVALDAVAAAHPGLPLALDFDYSAGAALDDRVRALLATIAQARCAARVPAVLTLEAPVTLDEQCAAAAYAVAGGVTLIVSDQPLAVSRAVRVTSALRGHESVAEPVAR